MWKKKDKKKYQYGLALSGGGTRGFAHLGVLKALEEHNIRPDVISGVSAGAIVGVLFADGNKPEDILDFLTRNKLFQFLRFSIPRQGLVQMSGFERTLKEMLKTKKIEDLGIPMKIFAVNINTADYTCFEKGDIVSVVKASSSIPIVFPPVEIDGDWYLDGGIINNFPLDPLVDDCETLIGVNVNPLNETRDLSNLLKIAERTFHISIRSHTMGQKEKCHIFIEPPDLDKHGLLDTSRAKEVFDLGYKEAMKALENS
jgi:NTE family protein